MSTSEKIIRLLRPAMALFLVVGLLSCGSATAEPATAAAEASEVEPTREITVSPADLFPDVLAVDAALASDGTWRFDVTLSSPYDSPERYADAWRVRSVDLVDGQHVEYGIRVLGHDHAGEQPFTRSQTGIAIPADVTTVLIEGRDQVSGWGGATLVFDLPSP